MDIKNASFWGYKRENGRIGVRNHVIILPVDDLSNSACEAVAAHIKGTMAIPHPYGRLQFGADLDLHFRTLIGTGCNPNVAAVVVIGIEPGWTQKIVDGIAASGKPVAGFSIEGNGDIATIAAASHAAYKFQKHATTLHRQEHPRRTAGPRWSPSTETLVQTSPGWPMAFAASASSEIRKRPRSTRTSSLHSSSKSSSSCVAVA